MTLSLSITALLNLFVASPDLCADVYLDPAGAPYTDSVGHTLSRYCQWTGPDVPVWNSAVCCMVDSDGAQCSRPGRNGRCVAGLRMSCKYGEALSGGGVVCYQPFPDACERGYCGRAPTTVAALPQESYMGCCSTGGVCQLVTGTTIDDCDGDFILCDHGFQNEDGTVECYG